MLRKWVSDVSPGSGVGWESYPTSLRIVTWVKWSLAGNELSALCKHSLAIQARWLSNRIEFHLLGNHLFANAKALIFAGLFFEGKEADSWRQIGLKILEREFDEQVLKDGGHFERSTMYHVIATEDVLDLINIFLCYQRFFIKSEKNAFASWNAKIDDMLNWLGAMIHPDGDISFFNDAAFDISPIPTEVFNYAKRLKINLKQRVNKSEFLRDSGYVRLQNADAVAILDMAPIGPDYLPGHGHADTLSFELSLFGHRLFVNSGTSCYGNSAERLRQRGTRAHNTVIVDNVDSSQVWGGFRVARRARPIDPKADVNDPLFASCGHNGYISLPEKPEHKREWRLCDKRLIIYDSIRGSFGTAEARFHFHPNVRLIEFDNANVGEGILPNGKPFYWKAEGGIARIENSTWHPRFSQSLPNSCLTISFNTDFCRICIHWK